MRTGIIAGLAAAVFAYPLPAVVGLGLRAGADGFEGLPARLLVDPPAQTSYVYAADGTTLLTEFYAEDRRYVPLTATSPWVQEAVIATEDGRFFDHHGVDLKGTIRAFLANQRAGGVSQGASTLTMQYVRNVLRDQAATPQQTVDATEQSAGRKVREMKLAVELEKTWSKSKILEGYLNVAYYGHQAYGIWAASRIFFGTTPDRLTLAQAALLAGLVQAPSSYDPTVDPDAARDRRDHVLDRMADLGYLSPALAAQAKAEPVTLHLTASPNDCVAVAPQHNDWGFFCDVFKQWWMRQPAFGANPSERLDNLRTGGYTIVTSLDPRVQGIAQGTVLRTESTSSRYALGEAVVQPGTGLVKALAVNRRYALDQSHNGPSTDPAKRAAGIRGSYPNTVAALLGGGNVNGYQAGSTFKMFTMLAALEQGYTLNTAIYAPQRLTSAYYTGGGRSTCAGGHWCPVNASRSMTGVQTMWSGFGKSVNTYWVQLEQRVGAANVVAMAERLGLTWHTPIDQQLASPALRNSWGAFTLGVADTTPLEVANAYATVAADGIYCEAMPVVSITGPDGKPATSGGVPVAAPRCSRAVSQATARAAADAALCTTGAGGKGGHCGGWSTYPGAAAAVGRPFA
ncbi:MAG TPA: transglycosylase domain-containing protein, partial [Rugosimonospora sp.]|nr:transglycosylase domain-containing protein [Rugosimonospora sp.]